MSAASRIALVASLLAAAAPAWAVPPGVEQLIGTFVGRAQDEPAPGGKQETRDIVMRISPHQDTGLGLEWNNVTLVDGRRDVPGVKFRRDDLILSPMPDRSFFLAGVGYDPFVVRTRPDAVAGDPLRWATVNGDSLDVFIFTILDDGSYELQTSSRHADGDGIRLDFERIVDGELVRHMSGHAVRAE